MIATSHAVMALLSLEDEVAAERNDPSPRLNLSCLSGCAKTETYPAVGGKVLDARQSNNRVLIGFGGQGERGKKDKVETFNANDGARS